ncbi:hypothetical protein LNQ49_10935 [Flavobacterium sp. F-65]|uniref:Bacteriocin-type signal sequence-containing protein n=1 Tax=Flavobacterium pisciphilum TaxID=2893755 RepID=A0ABS8MTJ6_9FLAO|nr:hypothetical protein [Flavobacterium sp. F-65]MCC9072094.1 hypothetical protein [Flavobacterium sp. F-65]
MLKSISNLKGAQELTKNEQKKINGGEGVCPPNGTDHRGRPCRDKETD